MVYVLLADGFEEIEALEPVDIMRRAGIEVKTVSIMNTKTVKGAHSIPVIADIMINEVNTKDMDLLMLPGGAGFQLLDASNEVHGLINEAVIAGKYISAICASPSILGKKQLLMGKKATCFPGFEQYCYGAEIVHDKAVIDGKIITGRGAGSASDFGFLMVTVLKDHTTAEQLKETMQYND